MATLVRKIGALLAVSGLLVFVLPGARSQPLDTAFSIPVGGIQQWISLKSADRRNPVLLFLHGGPGNSVISYSDKFTGDLRKKFVVVNWDQRESGKTADLNSSPEKLTVALMTSDAIAVIEYLRQKFSVPKIYLAGHSWGGFLGMEVVARHPELLTAYIALCPMIYQEQSERLAIEWMTQKATEERNRTAIEELAKIHIPYESGEQLYYSRKWILHFAGSKTALDKDKVVSWSEKWLALFNEASTVNFMTVLPRVACPLYFIVGGRDYQTSTRITTEYYNLVEAPDKQLFIFENAAHNVPTSEPTRLQKTILESIVPRLER